MRTSYANLIVLVVLTVSNARAQEAQTQAPVAVEPIVAPPSPPRRPPALSLLASLGAAIAIDGASSNGQPGALARLGVDLGAVEIAIEVHGGGPDTIDTPRVAFHLARGSIRAGVFLELIDEPEWRVPIGIVLGIAGWARLSTTHDPTLTASDGATSGGFTAGAEIRGQWLPMFIGGNVGLDLCLGIDTIAPTPRYVVQDGVNTIALATLWPVSPRASLSILVRAWL